MNKKGKNIELRIYELLGIKTFKKLVFKFLYLHKIPIAYILGLSEEERQEFLSNKNSYYGLNKGHGVKDLENFKSQLLFNALIHITSFIVGLPSFIKIIMTLSSLTFTIPNIILIGFFFFVMPANIYCIMLQRYNHIRINQVLDKMESREQIKKNEENLKPTELEHSKTNKNLYKIIKKRLKRKTTAIENATCEDLKEYRDYISYIKDTTERNCLRKNNTFQQNQSNNNLLIPNNKVLTVKK